MITVTLCVAAVEVSRRYGRGVSPLCENLLLPDTNRVNPTAITKYLCVPDARKAQKNVAPRSKRGGIHCSSIPYLFTTQVPLDNTPTSYRNRSCS